MTARTSTDLKNNLFQDGQSAGSITPSDMRDLIDSVKIPYMGVYVSTPAPTTISAAGTFVKLAGTTTVTNNSTDMDNDTGTSNRIRYIGTPTRHFHVVAQTTMTLVAGNNQNISISVYHYDASGAAGTLLAHSEARATISGTQEFQITTHADVMMNTDDYLEIWTTNNTATNNVEAAEAYLFAMGMM